MNLNVRPGSGKGFERWEQGSRQPSGSVALGFARSACQRERPDVRVVSSAAGSLSLYPERTDSLSFYRAEFTERGWSVDRDGLGALRHTYAMLIGLPDDRVDARCRLPAIVGSFGYWPSFE